MEKDNILQQEEAIEESVEETPAEPKKPPKKKKGKKGKKKKKIIIAAIILVVIAGAAFAIFGGKGGAPQGYPVTTGTAEKQDLAQEVSIKGTIQGSETADITSTMDGKITSIVVEEGSRVSKGQVLATLDGGDLADQYRKAQLALANSKQEYETQKVLYDEGAIAKSELDKAKATYDSDVISVNAFDGMDDTQIKSPISGTVTRVNVTLGRNAKDTENNQPMFVVENIDNLQMKVKISEYDISSIKVGQEVVISSDVLGEQTVTGVVSKISPTGEQKEDAKEMVIPVVIDVNNENSSLIAGVTAKATILIEKRQDILTVPIDAILENPETGELCVFVVKKNTAKKVTVTTGLEGDFNVEIASGKVSAGDQIVLGPTFDLTDGMEVVMAGGQPQ